MIAAQDEAGGRCPCDLLAILIGYVAFDIAHVFSAIDDARFGAKERLPHGTEEMDVQRHRGE
jgi:hypothetical protein